MRFTHTPTIFLQVVCHNCALAKENRQRGQELLEHTSKEKVSHDGY